MWLLWLRALYYLCFCCLFRPFSSSTHTHTHVHILWAKGKTQQFPTPCGVVPENHSTGQSEWFFSVDFSNRFRLIGVLALSFFPHTPTPTHTLPALSLVYFFIFKASHTHHTHQNFRHSTALANGDEEVKKQAEKRKTKLIRKNELY